MTTPRIERPLQPDPGAERAPATEQQPGDGNGRGAPGDDQVTATTAAVAAERRVPTTEPSTRAAVEPRATRRRRRLLWLVPILLIVAGISLTVGYRYWYESTYFVITDNAQVNGDLVQVGSLNAGRIVATHVEVGTQVRKDQELAVVAMPQQVTTPLGAQPRIDVTGSSDTLVSVRSPLSGVVAARMGYIGGTVAAGQAMYMLVDPRQVWIKANIDETKIARVHPGQSVEVHVDALDRTFAGRVEAVTPASAATFSLLPAQNASGNFIKVTQYVPVKIVVDTEGAVLPLGTSVEVRIQVQQPTGPLPW